MKKFYSIVAASLIASGAFAQVCTPSPMASLTVLDPLPTDPLNDAPVGLPFTKTISFVASGNPIDLALVAVLVPNFPIPIPPGSSVSIKRILVESVEGLPPGITSQCNIPSCEWTPSNSGCISLSGTPTQAGEYEVIFNTIFEIDYIMNLSPLPPQSGTFTTPTAVPVTYDMRTLNNSSIEDFSTAGLSLFPNPANEMFSVSYPSTGSDVATINVTDMSGKTVYTANKSINAQGGNIQIGTDGLANGMYRVTFASGNVNTASKLVVRK